MPPYAHQPPEVVVIDGPALLDELANSDVFVQGLWDMIIRQLAGHGAKNYAELAIENVIGVAPRKIKLLIKLFEARFGVVGLLVHTNDPERVILAPEFCFDGNEPQFRKSNQVHEGIPFLNSALLNPNYFGGRHALGNDQNGQFQYYPIEGGALQPGQGQLNVLPLGPLHRGRIEAAAPQAGRVQDANAGAALVNNAADPPAAKIPRPQNAFLIYRREKHLETKLANPGITNNQISKILGTSWGNETADVRKKFLKLADDEKKAHALAHPNYRYQPRRPNERRRRMTARKAAAIRAAQDAPVEETTIDTPTGSISHNISVVIDEGARLYLHEDNELRLYPPGPESIEHMNRTLGPDGEVPDVLWEELVNRMFG